MHRRMRSAVPLLGLIFTGCIMEPDRQCSDGRRVGILAEVRDSATDAAAAGEARMIVQDGAYVEVVLGGPPEMDQFHRPLIGAAAGRPGTYSVRVEKAGYKTWQKDGVKVTRAERCDVNTTELQVRLQR